MSERQSIEVETRRQVSRSPSRDSGAGEATRSGQTRIEASGLRCLNLGCGSRFHPTWTNLDVISCHPSVRACDLRKGIPFPDESFDVVYHSHILEHFSRDLAPAFIRECARVLSQGGVLRVAVPDLERIARLYLQALERATSGDEVWEHNYDWMMLELYDQVVRERSGGGIVEYLGQPFLPNESFILERFGGEAKRIVANLHTSNSGPERARSPRRSLYQFLRNLPSRLRSRIIAWILGADRCTRLEIQSFRDSGEIHHWMYDRFSLARLFRQAGLGNLQVCEASESQIPAWAGFCLDTDADGTVYKPDSIYVEAVKP